MCLAVGCVFPPALAVGAVALEVSQVALEVAVAADVAVAIMHPTQDNWVAVGVDALAIGGGYVVGKVVSWVPSLRLDWQHDAAGRLASQRLTARQQPLLQRRYHWQGADQLRTIEDSLNGSTHYQYDATGTLTGAQYADG